MYDLIHCQVISMDLTRVFWNPNLPEWLRARLLAKLGFKRPLVDYRLFPKALKKAGWRQSSASSASTSVQTMPAALSSRART